MRDLWIEHSTSRYRFPKWSSVWRSPRCCNVVSFIQGLRVKSRRTASPPNAEYHGRIMTYIRYLSNFPFLKVAKGRLCSNHTPERFTSLPPTPLPTTPLLSDYSTLLAHLRNGNPFSYVRGVAGSSRCLHAVQWSQMTQYTNKHWQQPSFLD